MFLSGATLLIFLFSLLTPPASSVNQSNSPKACLAKSQSHVSSKDSLPPRPNSRRVSAYYPVYNSKFQLPSAINYTLYTDLIFFVATTQANFSIGTGQVPQNLWERLARDFVKRSKAASVKPRLAVGGWTDSRYFSDLVSTEHNRNQYAHSLIAYAQKYGFEGIDLDWEYPTLDGIGCNTKRPEDIKNFGMFAALLKKIWPKGELTAAVSISGIKSSDGSLASTDLGDLVKSLDYINIMAYDVHGGWSTTTGPNAPFSSRCALAADSKGASVVDSVKLYQTQGFKNSQMVIGIPGYGRAFILQSSTLMTIHQNGTSSQLYQKKTDVVPEGGETDDKPGVDVCGTKTGWSGIWRYRELIDVGFLNKNGTKGLGGYVRHFDKCSGTPFLIKKNSLISYDDKQSTLQKARFARNQKLAGIFYFDTQGPTDSIVYSSKSVLRASKPVQVKFY